MVTTRAMSKVQDAAAAAKEAQALQPTGTTPGADTTLDTAAAATGSTNQYAALSQGMGLGILATVNSDGQPTIGGKATLPLFSRRHPPRNLSAVAVGLSKLSGTPRSQLPPLLNLFECAKKGQVMRSLSDVYYHLDQTLLSKDYKPTYTALEIAAVYVTLNGGVALYSDVANFVLGQYPKFKERELKLQLGKSPAFERNVQLADEHLTQTTDPSNDWDRAFLILHQSHLLKTERMGPLIVWLQAQVASFA